MAALKTITSASCIFMLAVDSVYDVAQQLQEFSVDNMFTTDAIDTTEIQVGVDGYGVAGYVPRAPGMTIQLLASSASIRIFENWIAAQDLAQDVLYANAVITIPALGRIYTCHQGALMRVSSVPDARKTLAPREFHVTWLPQGIVPAIASAPM